MYKRQTKFSIRRVMYVTFLSTFFFMVNCSDGFKLDDNMAQKVQSTNVTFVQNKFSSNAQIIWSGTLFTREVGKTKKTFVLTCGHGITTFNDIHVYKKTFKDGILEKSYEYKCKPIYHSSKNDLAVYMLNYSINLEIEVLDKNLVQVGNKVLNVGAFGSYQASDCVTSGMVCRTDMRLHAFPGRSFDVSNCDITGGFSGGGVFLSSDGKFIGMTVMMLENRGMMYKPIREIKKHLSEQKMTWIIDKKLKAPSEEYLSKIKISIDPNN